MSRVVDLNKDFFKIIDICSSQNIVKENVIKNHDDNLWWPRKVKDYRKRLIIAGLSTRISYNMIKTYMVVVDNLDEHEYEELCAMSDEELIKIIGKLGLQKARLRFSRSMFAFIKKKSKFLKEFSNNELIELIKKEVSGASYKVAQCCVLYYRGYHCGVVPVDSGMKDMLLPCLGVNLPKGSRGNEKGRKILESCVKSNPELRSLVFKNEYDKKIEMHYPLFWWTHLVLIYYKRFFYNKHCSKNCPLKKEFIIKGVCENDK